MIVFLIASRENTKEIFSALRAKTVMQVVMQSWESKLELFVSKGILPDSKEIRGTGVMRIFLLLLLFCVPVGALTTDVEVVHPISGGIAYVNVKGADAFNCIFGMNAEHYFYFYSPSGQLAKPTEVV